MERVENHYYTEEGETFTIHLPKASDWECILFGSKENGIIWRPSEGQEPNRFHRFMQHLCFGHKWYKVR